MFYVTESEPNRDENKDKHSEASQSFDNKIQLSQLNRGKQPQYSGSEHQVESDSRMREIESKTQRANMEAAAHENNQRPNTHVEILNSASTSPVSQGKCKNQQQQKSSKKPTSSSSNALCVPKLGRWGHYANTLHWFIKTLPQPDNNPSLL